MNQPVNPPILLRQDNYELVPPFKGDLFERAKLADRLEQHIARLPDGGVFVIDAPWGDGKTWFAKHWAASLKARGLGVIYVDAFRSDYVDDPFVVLTGEIV